MKLLLILGILAVVMVAGCARPNPSQNPGGSANLTCPDYVEPQTINCETGNCPEISLTGDPRASTPGTFKGHADLSLTQDPDTGKIWLSYSWPFITPGKDENGNTIQMATVETHLASSIDNGKTFSFERKLWQATPAADPEGGPAGVISSETPSIVPMKRGGNLTWYSARLRYFLEPQTGYNPNYATGWTVRIGAASSPDKLAEAEEVTLGVSRTASEYETVADLDRLAGLPLQHCAMLNNPTLFVQGETLYLIVECLAFVGQTLDHEHTSTQVFFTQPNGAPQSWTWKHAGELADVALAKQLGTDTIQQPDVSIASDGTPILIVTPAHDDPRNPVGTTGEGCVAVEIESLNPPRLKRDCNGNAIIRTQIEGRYIACTHHAASETGIIAGRVENNNAGPWTAYSSGLRP